MRGPSVGLVVIGVLFLVAGVIVQFGHLRPFVGVPYVGAVLLGCGVVMLLLAGILLLISRPLPLEPSER